VHSKLPRRIIRDYYRVKSNYHYYHSSFIFLLLTLLYDVRHIAGGRVALPTLYYHRLRKDFVYLLHYLTKKKRIFDFIFRIPPRVCDLVVLEDIDIRLKLIANCNNANTANIAYTL